MRESKKFLKNFSTDLVIVVLFILNVIDFEKTTATMVDYIILVMYMIFLILLSVKFIIFKKTTK